MMTDDDPSKTYGNEGLTGTPMAPSQGMSTTREPFTVRMVLLIGTPYDVFHLEEEHRVLDLLRREYSRRDLGYVPVVDFANGQDEAVELLSRTRFDLAVLFRPASGKDAGKLAARLRSIDPRMRICLILGQGSELCRSDIGEIHQFDHVLEWRADPRLFCAILTLVEDSQTANSAGGKGPSVPFVALVEDDRGLFSSLLVASHETVWGMTVSYMQEGLSQKERIELSIGRPLILESSQWSRTFDGSASPRLRPVCILAPFKGKDDMGVLSIGRTKGALLLSCEDLVDSLRPDGPWVERAMTFLSEALGEKGFVLGKGTDGEDLYVSDLRSLEMALETVDPTDLQGALEGGRLYRYLAGRGEIGLLERFILDPERKGDSEELRGRLIEALRHRRYGGRSRAVESYDRGLLGATPCFSKIGTGAMGGKARALHFMTDLLSTEFPEMAFEGMAIAIPRTVVICTDMFERFLAMNGLVYDELERLTDERIVQAFLASDLPPLILGDLRAMVEGMGGPLIVRSSSLLEDALFQPFAGIYASVVLSNSQMERDQRFKNLCTAVKYVYSSTYLSRARSYIRSTRNDPSSERMSVMVQEVVGRRRDDHFYPAFSGVGRSFDYWPQGSCSAQDGCVNLAVGLGKSIVDGGASFRFCPVHPNVRAVSAPNEVLRNSQRRFFAVRLFKNVKRTDFGEDSQLSVLDMEEAEKAGVLDITASTYVSESDRFYPGTARPGPRSVDFAPILQEGAIPLAELVKKVLTVGHTALGCPVEIEFAVEVDGKAPTFHLLQLRSMVSRGEAVEIDMVPSEEGSAMLECSKCLGNGIFRVQDIVMIKDREIGQGTADALRKGVSKLNASLQSEGRDYMLIGPGRWGSCDPWLGIPVSWNDISNAKVIVEVPAGGRPIDPSQGSHFFQNITSLRLGYMMLSPVEDGMVRWEELLKGSVLSDSGGVSHIKKGVPLEVRLDGRKGKGIVIASPSEVCSKEGGESPAPSNLR